MDYSFAIALYHLMLIMMISVVPVIVIIKMTKWMVKSVSRNIIPSNRK